MNHTTPQVIFVRATCLIGSPLASSRPWVRQLEAEGHAAAIVTRSTHTPTELDEVRHAA